VKVADSGVSIQARHSLDGWRSDPGQVAGQPQIPPANAPFIRRAGVHALRALPLGKDFALRAYHKLHREARRVRVAKTYFDASMECDLADWITRCIYHFGVWEPHISSFIQDTLKPGDIFCDIGANIGYDTLLASALVGASGRVIAVEPSGSTLGKLKRNLELNRASNVRLVQAAITDQRGTVTLYSGSAFDCGMASTVPHPGRESLGTVASLTMDDLLSVEDKARLKIIKIDVEGGEKPILFQILEGIDTYRHDINILVEMTPGKPGENEEIFARFSQSGFKAYAIANSYDLVDGYLDFVGIIPPMPMERPPAEQQDVVFSRSGKS
jgi:FkbM family methyltransferase